MSAFSRPSRSLWLAALVLLISQPLAAAAESLSSEQVRWLMPRVLQMHLTRPEFDGKYLKLVLKNFLGNLDPSHTLYLQAEVDKKLNRTDAELDTLRAELLAGKLDYFAGWLKEFKERQLARDLLYQQKLETADERARWTQKLDKKASEGIDFDGYPETEEAREFRISLFVNRDYRSYKTYLSDKEAQDFALLMLRKPREQWSNQDPDKSAPNLVMKAFMRSLDPHSEYMDAEDIEQFETSMARSFAGIGVQIRGCPLGVQVTEVIKGGPAFRSGRFAPNDQIVGVDGVVVAGETLPAIVRRIKGEKGSKVTLTVKKAEDKARDLAERVEEIAVVRDTIDMTALRVTAEARQTEAGSVGFVKVDSFYDNVHEDVLARIKDLSKDKPLEGLVLDLRSNSGGLLREAVGLAGLFISEGPIVSERDFLGRDHWSRDEDARTYFEKPLVVLVNQFSASAAEIVAGSLKDYGRAVVVGHSQTHGKGTVQRVIDLGQPGIDMPGRLRLTFQQYFLAGGDSVQLNGVQPDISIPGIKIIEDLLERNYEGAIPFATIKGVEGTLPADHPDLKKWMPWKSSVLAELAEKSKVRVAANKDFDLYRKLEEEEKKESPETHLNGGDAPKPKEPKTGEPQAEEPKVETPAPPKPEGETEPKGEGDEPKDEDDEENKKDPQLDEAFLILSDAILAWKKAQPEE
ncbi:MAG: S41 family peptidase [Planctomycetota bacterium]|nr:S41 family peptidase [Planctomycetota bacterium]